MACGSFGLAYLVSDDFAGGCDFSIRRSKQRSRPPDCGDVWLFLWLRLPLFTPLWFKWQRAFEQHFRQIKILIFCYAKLDDKVKIINFDPQILHRCIF